MRTTGAGAPPVNGTGGTVEVPRCPVVYDRAAALVERPAGHQARLVTAGPPVHGGGDLRRCAGVVPDPELGDAALDLRPGSRRPEAHAGPGLGWAQALLRGEWHAVAVHDGGAVVERDGEVLPHPWPHRARWEVGRREAAEPVGAAVHGAAVGGVEHESAPAVVGGDGLVVVAQRCRTQ